MTETRAPLWIEDREDTRWLVMNRPEVHNAFDDALIAALTTGFENAGSDDSVRTVVLAAEGRHFSAGADLNWMLRTSQLPPDENLEDARRLAHLFRVVDTCPKPTIALVTGTAYGGGLGLAATCDVVVAEETARFRLSETRLGLVASVIAPYVVRAMGLRETRRRVLTAEPFGAIEAHRVGLVHEVVAPGGLEEMAARLIAAIHGNAPLALATAKGLLAKISGHGIDEDLIEETARLIAELRAAPEAREGIAAFLEKRPPSWDRQRE